jgi:hypothetical protein
MPRVVGWLLLMPLLVASPYFTLGVAHTALTIQDILPLQSLLSATYPHCKRQTRYSLPEKTVDGHPSRTLVLTYSTVLYFLHYRACNFLSRPTSNPDSVELSRWSQGSGSVIKYIFLSNCQRGVLSGGGPSAFCSPTPQLKAIDGLREG